MLLSVVSFVEFILTFSLGWFIISCKSYELLNTLKLFPSINLISFWLKGSKLNYSSKNQIGLYWFNKFLILFDILF
jgi:hypothetical protein